jgi:hypothetical protein
MQHESPLPTRRSARGPARASRLEANRPYARRSGTGLAASASAQSLTASASTPSLHASPSARTGGDAEAGSPPQPQRSAGLLGSLGRAISRPLGWLGVAGGSSSQAGAGPAASTRGARSDDRSLALPSSASMGSLTRRSQRRTGAASTDEPDVDRYGSLGRGSLRAIGGRLASSAHASSGDLESQASGGAPPRRRGAGGAGAPPPPPPMSWTGSLGARSRLSQPPINAGGAGGAAATPLTRSTSSWLAPGVPANDARMATRSPSPARSNASAAVQTYGRARLSAAPTPRPSSLYATTPQRGGTPGASPSTPSFAFGYGSERRLAGLADAPLQTAAAALPSRSPFARRARASTGAVTAGSDAGRSSLLGQSRGVYPPTTSLSRPASLYAGSSISASPSASRLGSGQVARTRTWSSLGLAPPAARESAGESLLREYAVRRREGSMSISRAGSAAPGMDVDNASVASGTPGKRKEREREDEEMSAVVSARVGTWQQSAPLITGL